MQKKLLDYFSRIMPLTDEEVQGIAETMVIKKYEKETVLLREGQISSEAYFVLEGCVRQYYLVNGEEKINNFFTEEQWVTSVHSFRGQVPSSHFLACSTATTLVTGNRQKEEDLYKRFPKFESISRKIMEQVFAEQQQIMASYATDSPEQRYLNLLQTRPVLFQILPQYQLASYIGVKPESLSRIRKRIAAKKNM